jgi:transcription factor TFIIIB component B''
MDPPAQRSTPVTDTVADARVVNSSGQPGPPETDVLASQQSEPPTPGAVEQAATAIANSTPSEETDTTEPIPEEADGPRSRKKRTLPWAAVNRPQGEEGDAAPAPLKKTMPPPKPRGRKKALATTETHEDNEQEGVEGDDAQAVRKRPSAKPRGKKTVDAANGEDDTGATAAPKRTRRPRKVRNTEGADNPEAGEEDAGEQAEEHEELVVHRKPRAPRRRKKTPVEGEQVTTQPKRKGRPPREPTPPDAEHHEIDPDITFMDSIASRNIRVGKLSDREKAMREIDWVAVRQRRREEDARPITTKEAREAAEKLLIEEAPVNDGPRYQVVNGQIQVIHDSTMVNREADADREIENYEMVEERDLTTRITSRSFLKNNKRFPNDFILPGQGKRWTRDDTELFYQGLRNFGTDFQMISHMFPGSTRRSMKLKFTREERDDPERVREALLGESTIVSGWDNFMEVSQMQEQQFADADEIKRQMAEQEAQMRERIEAAKAETLERKRQQKEAGLLDDDAEGNEAGDKENGKGKKKRKGKDKQVTFQEEVGVEIVGTVDDDETWGQE